MAKLFTFSEAAARFGSLITTDITVEEAIQEAVDRIFEMGRWPGTTREVALLESDFLTVDSECFIFFLESEFDGAIGFRSSSRGWSIVDHTSLYKDGINMGDREWVDLGTVTIDGVEKRKYRAPLGFGISGGPYYALMKLEAPSMEDSTLVPVQSSGALKCAIQAVCHEYVGNDSLATAKWNEFDMFIKLSDRQVNGPKKFHVGMDSSLRRKPRQFN